MEENYGSDLSGALEALRDGRKIPRKSWTACHSLGLQTPDEQSANTIRYTRRSALAARATRHKPA
jgi:hypothetical protein